ncbi:MAG: ABC transporter permease [Verrucomicrobiales bacterium]
MKAYFIRRLLLVPLTLLGVTMLVFGMTRVMPGGPLERALQQAQQVGDGGGAGSTGSREATGGTDYETYEQLAAEYGYDQPGPLAYLRWLGLYPRERLSAKAEFRDLGTESIGKGLIDDPGTETLVLMKGTGRQAKIVRKGEEVVSATAVDTGKPIADEGWEVRIESVEAQREKWARLNKEDISAAPENFVPRAVVFKKRFSGLLQGDLGKSSEFGDSVWSLIVERIPIGLYFGILTTLITYGVCLPLGVLKAIKHRTPVDNLSSVLIFVGYAIPGFSLGALLLVHLGARQGWFPLMGLVSADFGEMSFWEQVRDLAHHTVLPLLSFVVGGFAYLTMMMKNNLMDQLAADYVRTAVAKGVGFNRAVFKHAFRNSIIPIATTLGHLIAIFLTGSILIEKVFDIPGFGLLQYQALLAQDQGVIMGTLTISAFLMLIGNILSDLIVALIDPRVKYQ